MPGDGGNGGQRPPETDQGEGGTIRSYSDAERLAVVEAQLQSLTEKLDEKPSGLKRLREWLSVIVAVAATGIAALGYWNSQIATEAADARASAAEERSAEADRRDVAADRRDAERYYRERSRLMMQK